MLVRQIGRKPCLSLILLTSLLLWKATPSASIYECIENSPKCPRNFNSMIYESDADDEINYWTSHWVERLRWLKTTSGSGELYSYVTAWSEEVRRNWGDLEGLNDMWRAGGATSLLCGDYCYIALAESMTYLGATMLCHNRFYRGELPTVRSREDLLHLWEVLERSIKSQPNNLLNFWLGLRGEEKHGSWRWIWEDSGADIKKVPDLRWMIPSADMEDYLNRTAGVLLVRLDTLQLAAGAGKSGPTLQDDAGVVARDMWSRQHIICRRPVDIDVMDARSMATKCPLQPTRAQQQRSYVDTLERCREATSTSSGSLFYCGAGFTDRESQVYRHTDLLVRDNLTRIVCVDDDECVTKRPCHRLALCTNTVGSFTCTCPDGYVGTGYLSDLNGSQCELVVEQEMESCEKLATQNDRKCISLIPYTEEICWCPSGDDVDYLTRRARGCVALACFSIACAILLYLIIRLNFYNEV